MRGTESPIEVERTTLGGALRNRPLSVPDFQREYSWKSDRVRKLFDDFNNAMVRAQASYFLGTVVTTPGDPQKVVDGQQRLATTSIFLAAVRDALFELSKIEDADSIQRDFLLMWDRDQNDFVPRLSLNIDDRSYYKARVLAKSEERAAQPAPVARYDSHRKINEAAKIAALRVQNIMESSDTTPRKVEALKEWVKFIDKRALLVKLTPPNKGRAYQMFKTLNDRAQRTTQGDLIKSHLFEVADKAEEAQSKWTCMRSHIEGVETKKTDDPLLTYLHHLSIVHYGPIKSEEIFEEMESRITSQSQALQFLESLAVHANDYAAILSDSHAKWGNYDQRIRTCIKHVSGELKMVFSRPLMLAVARHFDEREAYQAMKCLAAWVVRFLITGGHRSGTTEKAVGEVANQIHLGKIKTAEALIDVFSPSVPGDARFQAAFSTKTLTGEKQVRFLLRKLESQAREASPDALLQPVEDTNQVTLEHILPRNSAVTAGWDHFTDDERKAYKYRLGNCALIDAKDNGAIGDKPFSVKRPVIERSKNLEVTYDIITRTTEESLWTKDDIAARQEWMATLAVLRWPLRPPQRGGRRRNRT